LPLYSREGRSERYGFSEPRQGRVCQEPSHIDPGSQAASVRTDVQRVHGLPPAIVPAGCFGAAEKGDRCRSSGRRVLQRPGKRPDRYRNREAVEERNRPACPGCPGGAAMQLIYEKSIPGRSGVKLPASDVPAAGALPETFLRKEPAGLPEISELDAVRHFTNLSRRNFSVDTNFYPLGSCTMKYNAKVLENSAALFASFHPMTALLPGGEEFCQGTLGMLHELGGLLAEITGMDEVTTQPLAGAHGEMTGVLLISAYHAAKGNKAKKKYVVVPDSSHGTNPASAAIAGYEIITIPTAPYGDMDLELFKKAMTDEVAAVMMTCPNTLGLFNPHIKEISDIAHSHDALMYYDGANLNAIMGKVKPGDVGFDVIHMNLHKTFGTPHGGGGPGAGPVGVKKELIPFLPSPRIVKSDNGKLSLQTGNKGTIGRTANFFGNFGVMVKAY